MANKFRGEAVLVIEENVKALTLVFDANALCEVEDATGLGMEAIVSKMGDRKSASVSFARALLFGAARRNHKLTLEEAGDVISEVGFAPVMEAIYKAMTAAMPTAQSEDKKPGELPAAETPTKKAGTGKRS